MKLLLALLAGVRASAYWSANLAVVISIVIVTYPVFDCDLYWHLANGREMLARGQIVNQELFSFTHANEPFVNHEWLSQFALFEMWRKFGVGGLIWLKWTISALTFLALFHTTRKQGAGNGVAVTLCALTALAGMQRFHVRPELFSLLGVATLGLILYRYRSGSGHGHLWAIPVIMVIWDWLHGAVLGLVFLTTFVAAEDIKALVPAWRTRDIKKRQLTRLNGWFVVTIVSMLANPYGPRTYEHFLVLAGGQQGAGTISELQPIWNAWADWIPLEFMLIWTLTLLIVNGKKFDLSEGLIFLVFAIGALRYNRLAAISAIAIAPIVARHASLTFKGNVARWRRVMSGAWVVAACLLVAGVGYREKIHKRAGGVAQDGTYVLPAATALGVGLNELWTPAGAARFAYAIGLQGNMYNNANLGGYLAYAMAPERRIFQYNMPPIFGDPTRFARMPRTLDQWNIDYAFAGSAEELTRLFPQKDWAWVYNDYVSTLVVRRVPQFQHIVDQYEIRYFAPEQSQSQFEALAGNLIARPRLAFEMGVYLAYTNDARIAKRWDALLAADSTLVGKPRMAELVRLATARNGQIGAIPSRYAR